MRRPIRAPGRARAGRTRCQIRYAETVKTPVALLIVSLAAWLIAAPAAAQGGPDPWEQARYRIGPFAFTPSIVLSNLGVDTNVFYATADPKKDFTFSIDPQVDWWFRASRARVHGKDIVQGVYFATYASERSINQNHTLTLEVPLLRVKPYAGGSYLNVKERPGYEIDARARRTETAGNFGLVFKFTSRSALDTGASYTHVAFDSGEEYNNTSLEQTLNRHTWVVNGTFRYALTPLTTLLISADGIEERFVYSPVRDARSIRVMPGVEFKPFALISGTARIGYRSLNFYAPTVPDFSGMVADLNLGYTLLGRTRFGVTAARDIAYSYLTSTPYYVLGQFGGSITQQIAGPWDARVTGTLQTLDYRGSVSIAEMNAEHTDHIDIMGGGIGYRAARDARIGVNVDYYRRRSPVVGNNFSGLRAGVTVTYGL
jgi:hypothetical protein